MEKYTLQFEVTDENTKIRKQTTFLMYIITSYGKHRIFHEKIKEHIYNSNNQ